ncbi:hypothetical protein FQN50_010011 [Emmonsiellopsis sp. PD_5]|nr:hypothetical protein FQN50_010011 [Emmonsiellopsis sp. PD_5]
MSIQPPPAGVVLVISLGDQRFPDEMYMPLFTSLSKLSRLEHIREPLYVVDYLNNNNPAAILVVDSAIHEPKNSDALDKVKEYLSGGGTVVFACMFSSFIRPPEL